VPPRSTNGGIRLASVATVVIGGLLSNTLLTFAVIPVIYSLLVEPSPGWHPWN
jgi:Cu/Ag efflux pump CusA